MSVMMAKRRGNGRASGKAISTDIESITIGVADFFSEEIMQVKIGMNKSLLLFLFFVLHTFNIFAQKLSVSSFEVSQGDILARTAATCRYDTNDKYCALIKVGITLDGVEFECSGGVRDVVKKTGEYWVYLPQNNSKMRILHKDYTPLEINFYDYGIGKVQSGVTYVLTLVKPVFAQQDQTNISIPVRYGLTIEMVKVEGGTFMMGATPEMQNPYEQEKPVHQVTLTNDYYMGKYEVTQALWQAVMESNPSNFKGANLPVEQVSWDDCQVFLTKLNSMTGRKFRLPTEAEWEYAARGGKKSLGYQYSGSNNISDVAWYKDNSGGITHSVGMKQANELGIFDMNGNVWEWCQDWFDSYSSSSQTNPTGAISGAFRVFRGSSWGGNVRMCHLSCRDRYVTYCRNYRLGFRLALSE